MTYNTSINSAVSISIVSAVFWLISDISSGHIYENKGIYVWNFSVRLAIFLLVAKIIHSSINRTRYFEHLANQDDLTGILNRRGFLEKAQEELNRAKRFKREFSLAFIDLDNFKKVNDQFGHQAGDELLKEIAKGLRDNVRLTDQVGRMGGDEFAVLFVETDQNSTKNAFNKCHMALRELIEIQQWPVSISAGVITYTDSKLSLTQLMEMADSWMYQVKKSGKNSVVYRFDTELPKPQSEQSLQAPPA